MQIQIVSYCRELQLASDALYYLTTVACGQQTPGEEYCDIVQVTGVPPDADMMTKSGNKSAWIHHESLYFRILLKAAVCSLNRVFLQSVVIVPVSV